MHPQSFIKLILLAAIWGGSFLFLRIAAPYLEPFPLIEGRVGFAALFLLLVAIVQRQQLEFRRYWRYYLILGILNSAVPFLLFAYAAKTLAASMLSILNATAPLWGAVFGALYLRKPLHRDTVLGLLLGLSGVTVLVGFGTQAYSFTGLLAVFAGAGAATCYSLAGLYTQYGLKDTQKPSAFNNAHGSMWASSLLILPFLSTAPIPLQLPSEVVISVVALGVLCSGIAYLLYFNLIEQLGAASALTVTFLIPVFGTLWGALLLNETIGFNTLAGIGLTLSGTMLVTGFRFSQFRQKAA